MVKRFGITVLTKCLFRVNFDVDTEKMQLVLRNNLREFETGILSGESKTEDIVLHFNDTIQESFVESKTTKNKKVYLRINGIL